MRVDEPTLDELRSDVRRSSLGGAPMMLVAGVVWIATGALTFVLPLRSAAMATLFQGCVSMPLGLWLLPAMLKLPALPRGHAMIPLLVQCAMVQTAAIPALLIVYVLQPAYLPAAMAAVVGAHFLPYAWIQRIPAYAIAGGIIPAAALVSVIVLREKSFHVVGFVTGAMLLVLATVVRRNVASRPTDKTTRSGMF